MKCLVALLASITLFAGCGGGENIVEFNNAVASTMQNDLEKEGVAGDIDASCRPVKDAYTCDIFVTFGDGKRQRIGDANNVRRTSAGIIWDHES